jgi:hypothetical protein
VSEGREIIEEIPAARGTVIFVVLMVDQAKRDRRAKPSKTRVE